MIGRFFGTKKRKIDNTIATVGKAQSIVKSSKRIMVLAHELQDEFDLAENEVRLVFLSICQELSRMERTMFHRGADAR